MDGGWRYLWTIARRLRRTLVWATLAGLAWQGAAITAPLLIRHAIDAGVVTYDPTALLWACAGVVALGAVEAVGGAARHYYAIRNRARADAEVRDGIFRRALELDARYHDRVGAGELISRASNDAELVARAFDSIGHTIGYVLTVLGASAIMLSIDWRLALAVLAPLPLVSVGFGRYSRRYAERTKVNQEQLGEATSFVEETVSGARGRDRCRQVDARKAPRTRLRRERRPRAIRRVDLREAPLDDLDGLATNVRSRGVRLSSGERQLVSLARVAIADPAVIVLDEATSSLDPQAEAAVEQALAAVSRGRTVITIAHRLSTAERADRVAVMEHGRLIEIASHDELVAQGDRYARLWASWQAGLAG